MSIKKITEAQVKKACLEILDLHKYIHWPAHVFTGQIRGFGGGKWRVMKTGKKGMADHRFLFTDGSGRTGYLEFKRPKGGKQSQDQKDFEAMCNKLKVPYSLILHPGDLIEFLEIYDLLKVKINLGGF